MIFFIVICTVYIAVTAISYVLVKREYYKADAWMKIAVFGTTFLGFILGTSLSCLQMLCLTILLVLPIILSVMVLFSEAECKCECKCKTEEKQPEVENTAQQEKEPEKTEEKE